MTSVDGDGSIKIWADPVSGKHIQRLVFKVVDPAMSSYIAAVDGDAAALSCGDRIVGSLCDDRAAVDGNAAAITELACTDSDALYHRIVTFL